MANPWTHDPPIEGTLTSLLRRRASSRPGAPPLPTGLVVEGALRVVRRLPPGPGSERFVVQDEVTGRQRLLETAELPGPIEPGTEIDRALREIADAFRAATGPGVVALEAEGRLDRRIYLVWAYVPGDALSEVGVRGPTGAPILHRLLGTLAAMHEAGWVHGRLEPDDVVAHRGGAAWVGGWGGAIVDRLRTRVGGPVSSATPAPRDDVRAVGAVMRELGYGARADEFERWLAGSGADAAEARAWLAERVESTPEPPRPPVRSNVLPPIDPIVGRDADLSALDERFSDDRGRLVTLVGPAGVGKTRLALQWSHRALELDRLSGVTFVDVSDADRPESIALKVVRELPVVADGPAHERIVEFFTTEAEHLLVLDNCEAQRAAAARVVGEWLVRAPGLRCLATSREPLGLDVEQIHEVAALATEGPSSPAHRLFALRASAALGEPAFASPDPDALQRLLVELDGLPLAIELAAARVGLLSVREMVDRLSARFAWLRTSRAGLPPRRASLRGALLTSWERLPVAQQIALVQLAAFAGSFTVVDAEWVVQVDDGEPVYVVDLLEQLVAASWVRRDPRPGRLGLLATVRAFVLSQARSEPTSPADSVIRGARDRHLARFARLGHRPMAVQRDERPTPELVADAENLQAALDWAQSRERASGELPAEGPDVGGAPAIAVRVALVQLDLRVHEGAHVEALAEDLPDGLDALPEHGAHLLEMVGRSYLERHDADRAEELFERAIALAQRAGDASGEASIRMWLCRAHIRRLGFEAARANADRAIALGDARIAAMSVGWHGLIESVTNRLEDAVEHLAEAAGRLEDLGLLLSSARFEVQLARACHGLGRYDRAKPLMVQSIAKLRRLEDWVTLRDAVQHLVMLQLETHDLDGAARTVEQLRELAEGPQRLSVTTASFYRGRLGQLCMLRGELELGREHLEQATVIAVDGGFDWLGGWWQLMRGRIELDQGHLEHSRAAFARWRACDLNPDYQLRTEIIEGLGELASGETERASTCLDRAIAVSTAHPLLHDSEAGERLRRLADGVGRDVPSEVWRS